MWKAASRVHCFKWTLSLKGMFYLGHVFPQRKWAEALGYSLQIKEKDKNIYINNDNKDQTTFC